MRRRVWTGAWHSEFAINRVRPLPDDVRLHRAHTSPNAPATTGGSSRLGRVCQPSRRSQRSLPARTNIRVPEVLVQGSSLCEAVLYDAARRSSTKRCSRPSLPTMVPMLAIFDGLLVVGGVEAGNEGETVVQYAHSVWLSPCNHQSIGTNIGCRQICVCEPSPTCIVGRNKKMLRSLVWLFTLKDVIHTSVSFSSFTDCLTSTYLSE